MDREQFAHLLRVLGGKWESAVLMALLFCEDKPRIEELAAALGTLPGNLYRTVRPLVAMGYLVSEERLLPGSGRPYRVYSLNRLVKDWLVKGLEDLAHVRPQAKVFQSTDNS